MLSQTFPDSPADTTKNAPKRDVMVPETVLITGAAGFIGSNLSLALLARGHKVIGFDNLSMGTLLNLEDAVHHPHFQFVRGDVTDRDAVRKAAASATVIVHMAAFKIPRYGGRLDTLRINECGTTNVLEVARENEARVLLASTSDVYGRNPDLPFREDGASVFGSSTSARWSYAVSKLFDEHLAQGYHEAFGVKSTLIRIFGSYGPHQHLTWWGGPQSVFIAAIFRDEAIEIHGTGEQTRSFCYIGDLVRGWTAAVERIPDGCDLINLGNDKEITILELAQLIKRLSNTPGELKLRFKPYAAFKNNYEDVMRRIPDLSRAKELLGYVPQVSLEEGLQRTIQWQYQRMALLGELPTSGRSGTDAGVKSAQG